MYPSPLRHLLFLGVLLFVILSSGSLQCALHCYEQGLRADASAIFVTDCHPLANAEIHTEHPSSFCHRNHSASQAQGDPVLRSFAGTPALALLDARVQAPTCRSAEPITQPLLARNPPDSFQAQILPPSQTLRQVRSTVLLM